MKNVIIIGGTSGIGRAMAQRYLDDGATMTVVGRDPGSLPEHTRLTALAADLSLEAEQDRIAQALAGTPIDALIFTAGGLSAKSRVTAEGKDAAFMVNHVARARITEALKSDLREGARVAFITGWGSYKKPPKTDYVYGAPGRDGFMHVLNGFVPNDQIFAALAEEREDLHILGCNPGPTRGTQLIKRAEAPGFMKLVRPIIHLMGRELDVVADEFFGTLADAAPGISWVMSSKPLPRPPHLTSAGPLETSPNKKEVQA